MHSLFEYFQKFRDWFNGNDEPEQEDLVVLLERIQKMAVDLTQLVQEVDRVRNTQEKATALITSLVAEVKSATDQLVAKTAEAENTVGSLFNQFGVTKGGSNNELTKYVSNIQGSNFSLSLYALNLSRSETKSSTPFVALLTSITGNIILPNS